MCDDIALRTSVAIALVQAKRMRDSEIQRCRLEAKRLRESNAALVHVLNRRLATAAAAALEESSNPDDILLREMLKAYDNESTVTNCCDNLLTESSLAASNKLMAECRDSSISEQDAISLRSRAKALSDLLLGMQALEATLGSLGSNQDVVSWGRFHLAPCRLGCSQLTDLLGFIQGPLMRLSPDSDLGRVYRDRCVTMLSAMLSQAEIISSTSPLMMEVVGDAVVRILSTALGDNVGGMASRHILPEAGVQLLRSMSKESPLLGSLMLEVLLSRLVHAATGIMDAFAEGRRGETCGWQGALAVRFDQSALIFDLLVRALVSVCSNAHQLCCCTTGVSYAHAEG